MNMQNLWIKGHIRATIALSLTGSAVSEAIASGIKKAACRVRDCSGYPAPAKGVGGV